MTKYFLPTGPALKAGHPGVPCYINVFFLFGLWLGGLLYLSVFLKLVCYAHVFSYIIIPIHKCVHTLLYVYMYIVCLECRVLWVRVPPEAAHFS